MSVYERLDRTRAANRRAQRGLAGLVADAVPWLLAWLVAARGAEVVFFGFLGGPEAGWSAGASAVTVRLGWALIGWLCLDLYTSLVRGADREVLSLLPVDEALVVRAALLRLAWQRLPALGLAVVVLWPLGRAGAMSLWALCALVLAGSWALGLALGAVATLGAVDAARSPRWQPVLQAVRGNNTAAQAAFIYAPGLALAVGGVAVALGVQGLGALEDPSLFAWLLVPVVLAVGVLVPLPRLARATWYGASAVVAEIDARYAALEDPEERLAVFGDWLVRWVPASIGRYLLLDLRCGWRVRRAWVNAAWAVGLLSLVAGWSDASGAMGQATTALTGGLLLLGVLGVLLDREEPAFLRATLPRPAGIAALARGLALFFWLQPAVWVPTLALSWRHGLAAGQQLLAVSEGVVLVAVALALSTRLLQRRAVAWYGSAAVAVALGVGWWQVT